MGGGIPHNQVMKRDALLEDLKALHHGRGIRRSRVREWLGPALAELLEVAPQHNDAELRAGLARLLLLHTQGLPVDLRTLFRMAAGLDTDLPGLEKRLEVVGAEQDRSVRVLRRRLRAAEELVADSLTRGRPDTTQWWDNEGWVWEAAHFHLTLRADAVLRLEQRVLALSPHNKHVHQMFVVPGIRPDEELSFEAGAGLTVIQSERVGPTRWLLGLELPRELRAGESLDTVLTVRVPRVTALRPFMVTAPVREVPNARVTIDFGDDPPASACWILDGVVPSDLGDAGYHPVEELPAVGVVSREFVAPRVGLAYGIAWRPLDPGPAESPPS